MPATDEAFEQAVRRIEQQTGFGEIEGLRTPDMRRAFDAGYDGRGEPPRGSLKKGMYLEGVQAARRAPTFEKIDDLHEKVAEQRCWQEKGVAAVELVMERAMTQEERAGVYRTHSRHLRAGFRGEPLEPGADELAELLHLVGGYFGPKHVVPEDAGTIALMERLAEDWS